MFIEILKAVFTLFIIIDPFLSMSMFLTLTSGHDKKFMAKQAAIAMYVAGAMLLVFLVSGKLLLDLLNINMASFKVGGGIILLLLGIRTVMGLGFGDPYKYKASIVIIGTPMLSGPGALTTVIVVSQSYGFWVAAIACVIVLVLSWIILLYAYYIQKILGYRVIEVFSRIMGLLLTTVSVQYISEGIRAIIG